MGAEAAPTDLMVFTKSPTAIAADGQTISIHADLSSKWIMKVS